MSLLNKILGGSVFFCPPLFFGNPDPLFFSPPKGEKQEKAKSSHPFEGGVSEGWGGVKIKGAGGELLKKFVIASEAKQSQIEFILKHRLLHLLQGSQ